MTTEDLDRVPVAAADYAPPPLDSRDRRYAIPWEWWDAFGIYFVWVVISGAAAFAVMAVVGADSDEGLAAQVLVTLVILIIVTAGWVVLRGQAAGVGDALRRACGVKRIEGRDVLLGLGYGLGAFVVVQIGLGVVVTQLIEATGNEVPLVQQEVQRIVRGVGSSTLAIAFAVAVLAPIGEELLFRGVLYQALAKHVSGLSAISLSGFAFAIVHREPLVMVLTFPLGMALAWMLRRHGTIVIPVIAHAVFNVIGVLVIRGSGGA